MHAQQRLAAVRETEESLEADGEVEVATGIQLALPERLDPRQRALAQPQPGGRVAADRHVGLGPRDAPPRPCAVPVKADLPRVPEISEADVDGGVEIRLGAQIPLWQRRELFLYECQPPRPRRWPVPGLPRHLVAHPTRSTGRSVAPRRHTRNLGFLTPILGAIPSLVREIHLHDTRAGELRALEPRDPGRVSVYACGPTVYARIHVGNARPYVVFSWLKRFLEHEGLETTLAINVTDVNDKIYDAARAAGRPSDELAREMTAHYFADTDALGLGRPDHEPLASETIEPIKDLISALIDRGHAYASDGDVFFRVRTDDRYGTLSTGRSRTWTRERASKAPSARRIRSTSPCGRARSPAGRLPGRRRGGRGGPAGTSSAPRWRRTLLGLEFDVHGGGSDLLFPHHENEAAQTRAGRGRELARIWMHNGMLQMKDEKMAKSVGNIASLHQAVEEVGRDALLMLFANAHYRQPMAYSEDAIEQARASVGRVREAARRLQAGESPGELEPMRDRFFAELADDFNTHGALTALFEWVRDANRRADARETVGDSHLREMLAVLALENLLEDDSAGGPDAAALALLQRREAARAGGDYDEADRLRDELLVAGWQVRDGAAGPELVRAS